MTLSEAQALTDRQLAGLFGAYVERKRFEAKMVVAVVAEALKPKEDGTGNKLMSLGALAALGFGIQGVKS